MFDGRPFTVIGVAPAGAEFPEKTEAWFSLALSARSVDPASRGAHYVSAIGRLRPGVTLAAAERGDADDLGAAGRRLPAHEPGRRRRGGGPGERDGRPRGPERDPARARRRRVPAPDRVRERVRPDDRSGRDPPGRDGRPGRARRRAPGPGPAGAGREPRARRRRGRRRHAPRRVGDEGAARDPPGRRPASVGVRARPSGARLHRGRRRWSPR